MRYITIGSHCYILKRYIFTFLYGNFILYLLICACTVCITGFLETLNLKLINRFSLSLSISHRPSPSLFLSHCYITLNFSPLKAPCQHACANSATQIVEVYLCLFRCSRTKFELFLSACSPGPSELLRPKTLLE